MIAAALAGAMCGANVMLWSVLIGAARATDRDARHRQAKREMQAGLRPIESYLAVSRDPSWRSDWGRYGPGVARGAPGMGGRAED